MSLLDLIALTDWPVPLVATDVFPIDAHVIYAERDVQAWSRAVRAGALSGGRLGI